jgi:hypothetical protein
MASCRADKTAREIFTPRYNAGHAVRTHSIALMQRGNNGGGSVAINYALPH